ncbi:MAG: hypothetical protein LBQ59_02250 [Candidatus Peribacteria bacterium]|nr:hypothetical protein [Candidatus Peribacteria bacterium]
MYNFKASSFDNLTHQPAATSHIVAEVSKFHFMSSGSACIQYSQFQNSIQYGIHFPADFENINSLLFVIINLHLGVKFSSSQEEIGISQIFSHFS